MVMYRFLKSYSMLKIGFNGAQGQAVPILYSLSLAQDWAESTEWCDCSV